MEDTSNKNVQIEVSNGSQGDVRVLKIHGPLLINNFFEFQEQVRKQPAPKGLIIDLSDVPYMDSAALGTIVGVHVSCDRAGRKYVLLNPSERVTSLFAMSQVDTFLVTRKTMEEAESYLGGSGTAAKA